MYDIIADNQEGIPEPLRADAKQVEGKFIVSVVPKNKLDEFRNNNINLVKERDTLKNFKDSFKNLAGTDDLEAFKITLTGLNETQQKVKDGKLVEEKGLAQAVQERTTEMKTAYETQLRDAGTKLTESQKFGQTMQMKYKNLLIDQAIQASLMAGKTGLREDALPIILKEARDVFRVNEEDKVIPYQGDTVLYGADGATPMTATEWLKKLGEIMPFLLKESQGGGAGGGGRPGGGVDTSKMTPAQKMSLGRRA